MSILVVNAGSRTFKLSLFDDKAKELLSSSTLSITEVCLAVGFQSLGSFSTLFRRTVGRAPTDYRARAIARRRTPQRFIPACYLVMAGLQPRL